MRTVVGVLRGGPSREYDVSLKTGASVLDALDKEKFEPRDVFISKGGEWHVHGVAMEPERALKGVDVAFNALHGEYGEDGRVQRQLDVLGVPYTGSGPFASAIAFNKAHTKEAVRKLGVKVAHGQVLDLSALSDVEGLAKKLFRSFPHPAIIKPVAGGSSMGIYTAHSYHTLENALREACTMSPKVLIEECIPGKDVSVGVIDNFRNEDTYALIPTPNDFDFGQKDELTSLAKKIHRGLGLMHYSDSDFVVSRRGIYYLETNSQPKLHRESKLAQALQSVGASLTHFLDHVIALAHGRGKTV